MKAKVRMITNNGFSKPTVGCVSLGCSKNRVDSEEILGELTAVGFDVVSDPMEADVILVNTCGFIESAKTDSLDSVFEMARFKDEGRCILLVVCGCLTERYYDELYESLPEADLIWGVRDHAGLAEAICMRIGLETHSSPHHCCGRVLTTPKHRAYLRIADGCDNRCTYCAIPLIRGGRRSIPIENLVDEASLLAKNGVTELTVIAQDTSAYGIDLYGEPRICELLSSLSDIDGLHWIRLLYTYPNTVDERLIDAIRDNPKLCNYLDMPIQHIDPQILQAMNRHGTAEHIRTITDYVRSAAPDFVLRTTAMVGFPDESDEQFNELLAFLNEHPYDRVGAFMFSPEDGTPAALIPNQVDEKTKLSRLDRLMKAQKRISRRMNEARIGSIVEVLVDDIDRRRGLALCRSYAEAAEVDGTIHVALDDGNPLSVGQYVNVRITGADDYDLAAEITCQEEASI